MLLSAGSSQVVSVRACLEEQFHELAALFCSIFCSNSVVAARVTVWLHFGEDSLYCKMLHSIPEHDRRPIP